MLGSSQIELNYDQFAWSRAKVVSPSAFSVSVNGTPMQVTNVYVNPGCDQWRGPIRPLLASSDAALNITASGTASNPITLYKLRYRRRLPLSAILPLATKLCRCPSISAAPAISSSTVLQSVRRSRLESISTRHHTNITVENTNITNCRRRIVG